MDNRQPEEQQQQKQDGKRFPIFIPSHAQVLHQSRPQPPPSLFRPSSSSSPSSPPSNLNPIPLPTSSHLSPRTPPPNASASSLPQVTPSPVTNPLPASISGQADSFAEAFSFVKRNLFYSPPPPPPAPHPESSRNAGTGGSTSGGQATEQQPANFGQARNAILVSRRQQGNPVLKFIRNARWLFSDIVPDYLLGQSSCALFLSLRYHLLHPDYIYYRIRELLKSFRLRVVLCYVDVEDVIKPLHEVTKTALLHDCTLICAWSLEECARYLETIKIYENKPADIIQERMDHDYMSRLTSALTTIRRVNRTDAVTLGSSFGTLASVMGASTEDLTRCPGIGEKKVKQLYDAFHEPFRRTSKQARLSTVTSSSVSKEDIETEKQKASMTGEAPSLQNTADDQPNLSVRKALDAAYAKHGHKLSAHQGIVNEGSNEIVEDNPVGNILT